MPETYEEALKDGSLYHSVTVTKNTKGYSWEIKIAGLDIEKIKEKIVEVEKFCKDTYGNKD